MLGSHVSALHYRFDNMPGQVPVDVMLTALI